MREIKFRVWNNKVKKWEWPYPEGFKIIGEVTVFDMLKHIKIDDYNELIICQYTGLKDRNGKEIYESDLLIIPDRNGKKPIEIIYQAGSFRLKYQNSIAPVNNYEVEWAEIIGNVFENPELLGGKL